MEAVDYGVSLQHWLIRAEQDQTDISEGYPNTVNPIKNRRLQVPVLGHGFSIIA